MKKYLLLSLYIFAINAFSTDFESSTNSGYLSRRESIFGIFIGESTIDEVKKLTNNNQSSVCNSSNAPQGYCEYGFETENYLTVEHQGKQVSTKKPLGTSVIKFNIDNQYFIGKFIEGKIFELQVQPSSSIREFDDLKFINDLRSNFNKKYNKQKTFSVKDKDNFFYYTYDYSNWIEPRNSFHVELKEIRKVVINEAACLSMARTMKSLGMASAEFEFDCKKITDNIPKFKISYKDASLNLKAFKIVAEEEYKVTKEKMEAENKKINKF